MGRSSVPHMNGGNGEISYANNSSIQEKVILMTKPILEKAMSELYCNLLPTRISIADLGCSSGPNALLVSSEIIEAIHNTSRRLSHESPEVQIFLNDLPENDFNNLFSCLSQFQERLRKGNDGSPGFPHCYFTGVPGSFYDRCFPTKSLHFVHSSYSLHWLSQVPRGLEGNKGNIFMASTSPIGVLNAYYNQFKSDFSTFLKNRSLEIVAGGHMVLTMLGRNSEDRSSKEGCLTWGLLASALNDMVTEVHTR
ncbi:methyltransferase [Lithospermum erythrorhizon]|uniref:Methyltransferase n=1 Tax=Lithospermum erythrorhizon TaxID=34254 RepID=A0AAV3RWN1_LITER